MRTLMVPAALLGLALMGASSAHAMSLPAPVPAESGITLVAGGCGPGGHRNYAGYCVPNYRPVFRACPPGYHLGPYGRVCRPNY